MAGRSVGSPLKRDAESDLFAPVRRHHPTQATVASCLGYYNTFLLGFLGSHLSPPRIRSHGQPERSCQPVARPSLTCSKPSTAAVLLRVEAKSFQWLTTTARSDLVISLTSSPRHWPLAHRAPATPASSSLLTCSGTTADSGPLLSRVPLLLRAPSVSP